ncbi:MAG: type IV secretion system protein [Gammaproteobacteria bacterium]
MSMKKFIFDNHSNPPARLNTLNSKMKSGSLENPYVSGAEGRKEWNDRYLNLATEVRHWKIAFFVAAAMSVVLAVVIARIATESHVQPYVIETNASTPIALASLQTVSIKDPKLVNYLINQFVINAKTILTDTQAEKALLNKVYAYSAGDTLQYLRDYYQQNNPINLAEQFTVSVKIVNSMPISNNTWQVIWDETKQNTASGEMLNTTRWMADITYQMNKVNPNFINDNPFGLYITHLTWSPSQN